MAREFPITKFDNINRFLTPKEYRQLEVYLASNWTIRAGQGLWNLFSDMFPFPNCPEVFYYEDNERMMRFIKDTLVDWTIIE